ncbi:MAG TPA: hypothetical protein VMI75_12965 [Polyangiaceae bacterium]|nr:hypothetical protein [Polyangiaceae bacterium]
MRRFAELALGCLVVVVGCSSSSGSSPAGPDAGPVPGPGETCDPTTAPSVLVHFDPPQVVLAPGESRPVRVIIDPDMCAPVTGTFTMKDGSIASAPSSAPFDLRHPSFDFEVKGEKAGTTSLAVAVQRPADPSVNFAGDPQPTSGTLAIDVRASAVPKCSSTSATTTALSSSTTTAKGAGDVADASLSVPAGAFARTDELALPAFSAGVACGGDLTPTATPAKLLPLGPAVTFTPQDPTWLTHSLKRELTFAIPVNPAAMPEAARLRHLQVLYSGPMAKKPRVVTIANPHFSKLPDGNWVLGFESPWLGTYQAAVASNAGTVHVKRHLTHRAVLGISMGGGGAGIFGTRHHDQFDMIAPLGGNSELTWMVWYFEQFKFGGFCTVSNPNCTKYAPNMYPLWETYAHTEDFDHWFFQPGGGTGGSFSRGDWTQILEDFAIMGGNPNGQNADPAIPFMVTGPKSTDPFVAGTVQGTNCDVTIDPIGPNDNDSLAMQQQEATTEMQQQATQNNCRASQCDPKSAWVAKTGFYDADYNPKGTLPVISFCDGAPQSGASPYEDVWGAGGNVPSDLTLAVDLNGNGVRDLGEPVIRQGHEPYTDTGTDGVADASEPGYDATNNPDPNGDDYDFAINPTGTENDHIWEQGEPYLDVGVDGVANTPQQSQGGFDVGEGDGQFTMTAGAQQVLAVDPHQMLRGHATPPGGPLDTAALQRFDVWTDGGVRDMANFAAVGNHFIGSWAVPRNADGSQVKSTVFYDNFENLPGADPNPNNFLAVQVLWQDIASAAHLRFGYVDATPQMISQGDGQHVGTATQIVDRLVTGFYSVGSRWPDVDRLLPAPLATGAGGNAETTTVNELGTTCEISGHCDTYFTGPTTHRTGPIAVTLPPGYALEANRKAGVRYPVLYMLHGYGQDPRDLQATAAITDNYMRDSQKSSADRLAKMIVVYADGRCRIDPTTNAPECIRGTFYLNEHRQVDGHPIGQLDDWFEELMTYIDRNYRTLGPTDVDWVE